MGGLLAAALICSQAGRAENPLQPQNAIVFRNGGLQTQRYAWPREAGSVRVNGLIMNATAGSTRWVTVHFRTMAEPPLPTPGSFGGGILRDQNTVHRLLIDKNSQAYFGYDLVVTGDAATGYLVAFQPLSNTAAMLNRFASGLQLLPMPPAKYPASQSVQQSETIALDVMVSPSGQQKIVDYLQFSPPEPVDLPPASSKADPRDFTVDDQPLTINLDSFERTTVLIDGQRFTGRVGFADQKGGALWMVFPGQGRYVLSLAPHPGFTKAGVIREHAIAFHDGARQFEVRLATSIASAGDAWNLYIHHDPAFQPKAAVSDAVIVGTGRLENLLP